MQGDVGCGRHRLGRLEVDDPDPAVRIAFDPVGAAGQLDPVRAEIDHAAERDLGAEQPLTGPGLLPGHEPFQRRLRLDPLDRGQPVRVELQLPPDRFQVVGELVQLRTRAGSVVGEHVHHRPEARRGAAGTLGRRLAGQEPLPRAGQNAGQLAARRAGPARPAGTTGRSAQLGVRIPHQCSGPGPRDQRPAVVVGGIGEPGQPDGGLVADSGRGVRVDADPAQLADQRRQGQRPARPAGLRPDRHPELGKEPGGLVTLALGAGHRGHHQPRARPGAGDVEQPPLLGDPAGRGDRARHAGGAQPVRLQQRPAAAYVRPAALLDAGHHHQCPLQTFGPVGGQQPHGPAAQVGLPHRVGGDLLALHLGEERGQTAATGDLLGARRDVEQGADRVQVPVGPATQLAAAGGVGSKPLRPVGAGPEQPQRLLGAVPGPDSAPAAGEQVGQPLRGLDLRPGRAFGQPLRIGQPQGDQLGRGPGQCSASQLGPLGLAQRPAEPAYSHAVQPAERRGEQALRLVRGDPALPGRDLQAQQQRPDRGVGGQRDLVPRHLDRYAGRHQRPGQAGDRCPAGPDQHGHVVPAETFAQVGTAQDLARCARPRPQPWCR